MRDEGHAVRECRITSRVIAVFGSDDDVLDWLRGQRRDVEKRLARFIDQYLIDLSNIHIALLVSPAAFLLMIPVGWASYRFIESPFLKFRTNYLKADEAPSNLDRRMDVST